MSRWRLNYVVLVMGDSPVPRTLDVEIDTEGLDPFGADKQLVIDRLHAELEAQKGKNLHINSASPIDEDEPAEADQASAD